MYPYLLRLPFGWFQAEELKAAGFNPRTMKPEEDPFRRWWGVKFMTLTFAVTERRAVRLAQRVHRKAGGSVPNAVPSTVVIRNCVAKELSQVKRYTKTVV